MEKGSQGDNLQDPLLPGKNQDLPANLETSEDNQMIISKEKDEKYEEAKNSKSSENNSALQPKSHHSNHSPQTKSTKPQAKKLSMEDFDYARTLGKGSFGEVILVQKKSDQKMYAMKAIDKNFLYKEKKQYQVYIEKEVLMRLNHPNLPKLYYSFQDKFKLFFVMEYCENGEFSDFLRMNKKLDIKTIQFYTGEIVNILEYLHNNGVSHRDLKPENLMLGSNGHLKIIDFGTAYFFKSVANDLLEIINKIRNAEKSEQDAYMDYQSKHKATFVGTAEYVSPELLEDSECAAPADLWALGCIVYRMFVGVTPFYDSTEYLMFSKIKKGDFPMSPEIPLTAQDLIRSLLKRNPRASGNIWLKGEPNDFKALKAHPFFEGLDFDNLSKINAPLMSMTHHQFKESGDEFEFDNLNPYKIHKKNSNAHESQNEKNNQTHKQENKSVISQGNIVLTGLAMRKCGWLFYEPILLVLKDNKMLSYYDPETQKLKGEIDLDEEIRCELINKTKFMMVLPNRKYYFKEIENPASLWVEMINQVINLEKI